jgi:hypothetical protein
MPSAASRPLFATRSKTKRPARSSQKSAITNGTKLLPGNVDNRSPWVRRCRDIMENLTSDRGGASEVTAAEASIIRRAAVLSVELESMETTFAKDGQASGNALDLYA